MSHLIGCANIELASRTWNALITWMDTGHFAYFERPDEFASIVWRFLDV